MLTPFLQGYLLHLALGLVVAAAIWLSGIGLMARIDRRGVLAADRVAFGYPLGLLLCSAASFLALLGGIGAVCGGAAVVALACLGWNDWRVEAAAPRLHAAVAWVLAPAAAIALILGLLNRGPGPTLGSSPLADVVWFAERIANLAASPVPPFDFLVEGQRYGYAQQGFGMIGAALSGLPGFDAFLFNAVTGQVVLAVNLAIVLGLLARDGAADPARRWAWPVALLLLLGAPVHPSWTVQSVPLALLHPLLLVAYRAATGPRLPLGIVLLATAALVAVSYLTKLFCIALLLPPFLWQAWGIARDRLEPRRRWLLLATLGLVLGSYVLGMLWIHRWDIQQFPIGYLPFISATLDVLHGVESPQRLIASYARDVAILLLLAWAWRRAPRLLVTMIAIAVVGVWAWPPPMRVALTGAIVLAGYRLIDRPGEIAGWRWPLLAAALSFVLHGALLEYNSPTTTAAILAVQALVVAAPLWAAPAKRIWLVGGTAAAAGFVVAGCLTMAVADRWFLAIVARNWQMPLSHAAFDIWREVGRSTPPDALVFTDQTGDAFSLTQGLNYYAGLSGRQVYLAGWYASPLRSDEAMRRHRLAENAAVLDGRKSPAEVAVTRRYGAHYAVVDRRRIPPPGWREIHRNAEFALYQIGR